MKLTDLKDQKLIPRGDLIAFKWLKPKTTSGILIPEQFYDLGFRPGRFYLGKVFAIGSKVNEIKPGDTLMIHEYGIKNFPGAWLEDFIYFIEEEYCKCKITGIKKGFIDIRGRMSKKSIEELESRAEITKEEKG